VSTPVNIYDPDYRLDLAIAHLSRRRLRAAEREARAVLRIQPDAFVAYTALASALRAQHRYKEACDVVFTALHRLAQSEGISAQEYAERHRAALQLRVIRAACLTALGDDGRAIAGLRALRDSEKGSEDYWLITFDLANALYAQRAYDEAEMLCQEAILDSPPANAPHLYLLLGSLAETRQDTAAAADFYRLALHGPALVTYAVGVSSLLGLLRLIGLRGTLSFCRREGRQFLRQLRSIFSV
jgi:tetratricopeptide (TPR) repeat protein